MEISELKEGMRVAYPGDRGEHGGVGTLEFVSASGGIVHDTDIQYVWCYVKFHTPRQNGQTHSWWSSNRLAKR